jgi:hypothetical protein
VCARHSPRVTPLLPSLRILIKSVPPFSCVTVWRPRWPFHDTVPRPSAAGLPHIFIIHLYIHHTFSVYHLLTSRPSAAGLPLHPPRPSPARAQGRGRRSRRGGQGGQRGEAAAAQRQGGPGPVPEVDQSESARRLASWPGLGRSRPAVLDGCAMMNAPACDAR